MKTPVPVIIVCEDDIHLLSFLVSTLKDTLGKHQIIPVMNGQEALAEITRISSSPEQELMLVITDIDMPGIDGITLTKQIQSEHPTLPIIIMSGNLISLRYGEELTPFRLLKPFAFNDFMLMIYTALAVGHSGPKATPSLENVQG